MQMINQTEEEINVLHILHPFQGDSDYIGTRPELRRVQFAFKKILMNQIASNFGDIET
jgi:hypothetical protein